MPKTELAPCESHYPGLLSIGLGWWEDGGGRVQWGRPALSGSSRSEKQYLRWEMSALISLGPQKNQD